MKKKCLTTNNDKLVVFKEKRSKLTIVNRKQVSATKVIVDDCVITSGIRCDFLYIINKTELFIELKGQDLNHALDQLETTIKKLSKDSKKFKKKSFIICTRSPLNSASIQNHRVKFRKNFNSELIVKNSPHKHYE